MIKKLLLISFVLLLWIGTAYSQTPTPTPCPPNPVCNGYNIAPVNKKGWQQGSTVQYYIDPAITDADAIGAIEEAFQNWENASAENGSNITYQRVTTPLPAGTGITLGQVNDIPRLDTNGNPISGQSVPAETRNYTYDNDLYTTSANIVFDSVMTDRDSILQVISHEIGHPAGFGECSSCDPGEEGGSIMGSGNNYDPQDKSTFNSIYGRATSPTCCDKKTLKNQNYPPQPTGGGGNEPSPGGPGNPPPCTPYYWVYYESYDGGQTWQPVDAWYAGCW